MNTMGVKKFRLTAGVIYLVLSIYQMFFVRAVLQGSTLTDSYFVRVFAVGFIFVFGAMAVWMFTSPSKALHPGVRRAVIVGTILMVAYEVITFPSQAVIVNYTFRQSLPGIADMALWQYVFIIIRLVLSIVACFLVMSSTRHADDPKSVLPDGSIIDENRFKKQPNAPLSAELDNPLTVKTPPSTPAAPNVYKPSAPEAKKDN